MAEIEPPAATTPAPGNGKNRTTMVILIFLGVILAIFSTGHVAIGVLSWFHEAGDPQGVNVVRGDSKDVILYILGVLSGALVPRINH